MNIRLRHTLGFVLAVSAAIGFSHLSQLAIVHSFEVSDPPYWTSYLTYFRVFSLFSIPIIIGSTFERRALLFGALAALVFFGYFECSDFISIFQQRRTMPAGFWQEQCFASLIRIAIFGLLAALMGWCRFKWYPRSRFGTIKLRLILVFFAFVFVGGNLFLEGMHGLYNEYRLSTAGVPGKVTEMFEAWPSALDAVIFKGVDGEAVTVEVPGSPARRERFDRGEEMVIRYVPGFGSRENVFVRYMPGDVYVVRWEGEDNTPSILSKAGIALIGLVSMGLGMLFWRRVSKLSTYAA